MDIAHQLPSPASHCSSSDSVVQALAIPTRTEPVNLYPTTFVQADTASFKQVVQMLTGSPRQAAPTEPPRATPYSIPPVKAIPKKFQASSGFKLFERRNSIKNFKISPLSPFSGFSPARNESLSPSVLDFPSLVLSPVTPLNSDPWARPATSTPILPYVFNCTTLTASDMEAEDKAIQDKAFYLHRSPVVTPREDPPRLLPLFPLTSPNSSRLSECVE